MEKDFDQWNKIKKETDQINSLIKIRAGEIRWCRIGINVGFETIGKGDTFRRPVLILKKFSGDVFLGLPLTTKRHGGDWYYEIKHDGVSRYVILNQGRILDKRRLEERLFEISDSELLKIKKQYCYLIIEE